MTVMIVRVDQDEAGSRMKLKCSNCLVETYVEILGPVQSHRPAAALSEELGDTILGHRCL